MPFDVDNSEDFNRLRDSVRASIEDLSPFRENYRDSLKQLVGATYSRDGNEKVVPINLIELAKTIFLQNLISAPPRVHVSTYNRRVRPAGQKMQQAANDSLHDYTVYDALRQATAAAIGSIGIVKVGIESQGTVDVNGFQIHSFQPYVMPILLDDWVQDMSARSITTGSYEGHQYERPLDEVVEDESLDPEFRKHIQAAESHQGLNGETRTSAIQGERAAQNRIRKVVQLWDIFLPETMQLLTMSLDVGDLPATVVDWTGPDHGPFHKLWFAEVDGNSMPQSPMQLWRGLHEVVNGTMRKLIRQADRQKTIMPVDSQDAEDATRINQTNDGFSVAVRNPSAIKQQTLGGIDQSNFAFMLQMKTIFEEMAGNLTSLGGLGPSADTGIQDKMITASGSKRITMMQNATTLFVKRALTDYCWYMWEDPAKTYPVEIVVPGYGPIQSQLSPDERTHDFYEHQLDIEPYSMVFKTPQDRIGQLNGLLTQFLLPAAPLMQADGMAIDWEALLRLQAEYMQMPELAEVITKQGTSLDANEGAKPAAPKQPAVTSRTNTRISSPGKSSTQNRDGALIQKLMGGNLQPAEQSGAAL